MSSWSAVLKTDGPVCPESVVARRNVLRTRGLKKLRMKDKVFTHLHRKIQSREQGILCSSSKHSRIWAMPNADHSQYTIGILDYQAGWRASGWVAEHIICLNRAEPMPDLEDHHLLLRPRLRRLVLELDSFCCFCGGAMPLSDITIEHWLAKSLGGDSRPANLRLAHRRCNEIAGSKTIAQKEELRHELTLLRARSLLA